MVNNSLFNNFDLTDFRLAEPLFNYVHLPSVFADFLSRSSSENLSIAEYVSKYRFADFVRYIQSFRFGICFDSSDSLTFDIISLWTDVSENPYGVFALVSLDSDGDIVSVIDTCELGDDYVLEDWHHIFDIDISKSHLSNLGWYL